jgi:SGNH hydrolase-like domain, acetyltransferase AlgX
MNITSHVMPELPIVGRWDAYQTSDTEGYGDLAAMAGDPSLQERRKIVFRTDEFGFRNRPGARPTDVLIVGDSFPAGAGTTDEEIFPRLLEDAYGFRTYNLSFPGGPYQQLINFAIEWPKWNVTPPYMIWTLYTGNDMEDEGGKTWDLEHLPWQHGLPAWRERFKSYRRRSPIHQWIDIIHMKSKDKPAHIIVRSLPDGNPILFFGNQETWANRSRQEVEQHPNFAKLQRTLVAMRRLTAERHVQVKVLILPTKGEVYRWLLEERQPQPEDSHASGFGLATLEACRTSGMVCHDMKPYLLSEAKHLYDTEGKLLWWRDDTHIGKYGHAAIAAYIVDNVLRVRRHPGNGAGETQKVENGAALMTN